MRTVGGNEERRTWAAIVERQQEEIEALKQEVGELKSSLEYAMKGRFEPLARAALFDGSLHHQTGFEKSAMKANTGLKALLFHRMLNEEFDLLKAAGRSPVSPEDLYLYLMYCRTGLSVRQLQDSYQQSESLLHARYHEAAQLSCSCLPSHL